MSAEKENGLQQAKENWEMYYMLTQELLKFINQQDIDQFLELEKQRNTVVERMKALPETEDYRKTAECQALVAKIKPMDMQIMYRARSWLNKAKRNNMAVKSYDITGFVPSGNVFNREY